MTQIIRNIGQIGEQIAENFLKSHGFLIIERNFEVYKVGEIDIVALKNGVFHFIEVKTSERVDIRDARHTLSHFDKNKKERIISVMQRYCFSRNITTTRMIDLIAVNISRDTYKADVSHIQNVYIDTV